MNLDINFIRGMITFFVMACFLYLCYTLWRKQSPSTYDEVSHLPIEDHEEVGNEHLPK